MKVRKQCSLKRLYADMIKDIKEDSPDLVFATMQDMRQRLTGHRRPSAARKLTQHI